MLKIIKWSLIFVLFFSVACSNSVSKKKTRDFSCENISVQIECPDNTSYYLVNLANDGEGSLAFCFERADSSELIAGKTDSLLKTATFRVSQVDLQILDTLISQLPTKIDSRRPRDTFKYILKIDDKTKISSSDDGGYVYKLLKVLVPYFPKNERTYDFCEFFKVFKTI